MFSSSWKKKDTVVKKDLSPTIKKATQSPKTWPASELNGLIAAFIPEDKIAASLARTCRFFYHSTKAALEARKLKTLAHHVIVEPNENKVTAMLNLEPTLVNAMIKEVIDNSGRILLDNKILQLAFGAGNYAMCLAIKPFFIGVYGSEKAGIQEMKRQRNEKFAENKKEDDKADEQAEAHLAVILKPAIKAITDEKFNSGRDADNKLILSAVTLLAIDTFRKEFAKSQPKRIKKGMHFRDNTLQEIYNAYVKSAAKWDYDYNRCALFEDGILSCVLLCVPANDAQKFSWGLHYLQCTKEKYPRSFVLRDGKNNFYRVCAAASIDFSILGSCIDILLGTHVRPTSGRGAHGPRLTPNAAERARMYQNSRQTKYSNLRSVCALSTHTRSRRLSV